MIDERERVAATRQVVLQLVTAEGISEGQASELVAYLGFNWSSLVREARLIRKPMV